MRWLLYLFAASLQCITFAYCEEEEAPQNGIKPIQTEVDPSLIPSLVNLTSMPTGIVNGSVNVITGDLCEYDEEDIIFSSDPYVLGHTYYSSSLDRGSLGDGWNFLHHHLLEVYQPDGISYTKSPLEPSYHLLPLQGLIEKDIGSVRDRIRDAHNNHGHNEYTKQGSPSPKTTPLFLTLYDPSGGGLLFKAKYDQDNKQKSLRHFKLVSELTGYTNVVGGSMSGQTNIKNSQVRWEKATDSFHVTHGDGTKRTYVRRATRKELYKKESGHNRKYYRDYLLEKEIKPNGNVVIYHYNDKHEIIKIRGLNRTETKELYWVDFDQRTTGDFAKHPTLDVRTSDSRQHTYYFQKLKGSYMHGTYSVSHIRRQGRHFTNYVYSDKSPRHDKRVQKKETEGGFYVSTKYYRPSDNWMDSRTIKPKNKKESKFLRNRVRMQSSPLGPNGQEVITHRYFYYQDEDKAGHCTVRDVYNNISRYYWNKDKRLTRIAKCDSSGKKLMSEKYYWGKNKSKDEGRLLCRLLQDEKNRPVLANTYKYDSRGNILEESLYGRITENAGELTVKNGIPHHQSCDKQTTRYGYTNDGFNLITHSVDPAGNYTYYEYVKGTNLLSAKFICDKKAIKKREFYEYNTSGIVIEYVVDDGSSKNKNDFTDATERHITRTKIRSIQPRLGEPEEISEFFYNFAEKKEAFLKKTINHFNEKGFVAKQEHVDQLGGRLFYEYEYDDAGRVIYSKNPLGHTEHREYDILGRITKKTGPREDVTLLYEYDIAGRCTKETEKHESGLERTVRYEYDLLGRKIAVIDVHNCTTRYEYDALNRITSITYPAIFDHKNRKIVPTKKYSYSHLGSAVSEIDENGLETITKYNALGKACEKIFPDKTKTSTYYDIQGNPVKEISQNGAVNGLEYDAFGRVVKSRLSMDKTLIGQKEITYNSFHPILEIGFTGEKTAYSYDYAGRKAAIETQDRRVTKFVYDARGRLYRQRAFFADGGFVGKRFKYDALNRVTYESVRDHKKRVCSFKEYDYDCEGNVTAIRQKIGGKISEQKSSYLPGGRLEAVTDPLGNVTRYSYDYNYKNNYGQRVLRTIAVDARQKRSEQIFDTRGNLSLVLSYDPNKTLIAKKELFYDAANNLVRTKEYAITPNSPPKKITTTFIYKDGHLVSITEAKNTPEQKVTQFAYNEYGQRKSSTFQDGTIIRYRYDGKGRVKRFFSVDKSIDYRYTYDALDRVLSLENAVTGKTTTRSYNAFGELELETLESEFALQYDYDDIGRVKSLTLPDGSQVLYERSAYLEKITRTDQSGAEWYRYTIDKRDQSALVNRTTLVNGSTLRTQHDLLGRCKKIAHPSFTEKATGFDATGNLLGVEITDAEGSYKHAYGYDFFSQLTQEDDDSYSYDSLNNRICKNDTVYEHNSLHAVISGGYGYDARGNRTSFNDTRYSYDALDRLIEVEKSDKRYVYSYDGFNRRIQKEEYRRMPFGWQKEDATQYLYSLDNEIGATDAEGMITQFRVLGEGLGAEISAAVAHEFDGKVYVPIHNRQGSVTTLLDLEGNVVERYRYDAFGNQTSGTEHPINPWRFASKRHDPETGLINFGRRYYDPALGKWLTQDPLGLRAGPNLYAYCLNNPLSKFDLYGLLARAHASQIISQKHAEDPSYFASRGYSLHSHPSGNGYISVSYGTRKVPGLTFVSVNGLDTELDRALELPKYYSSLNGGVKVHLVYDPKGKNEFFMALLEKIGLLETGAQQDLKAFCETAWEEEGVEENIVMLGYSRGNICIGATQEKFRPDQQNRTINVGLCPGRINSSADFLYTRNIVNMNPCRDPVPWTDFKGLLKSLLSPKIQNDTIFCPSHPEQTEQLDHSFDSKTYEEAIKDTHNYIERNFGRAE